MKSKKGDLVEIIGSDANDKSVLGKRFILDKYDTVFSITLGREISAWETPYTTWKGLGFYAKECYLKKINPDGDEISNLTFEELMGKLKTNKLEHVEM